MQNIDHIRRRETRWGRWLPFGLFALDLVSWALTAVLFHQERFLALGLLPFTALVVYVWRTGEMKS